GACREGNCGTNGYITTAVAFPASAAGQPVQLRWRAGADNANAGGGWRVDSIAVTGYACCGHTPPVLAAQTNRTVDELTSLTVTNASIGGSAPPRDLTYSLGNPASGANINSNGI